MKNYFKQVIKKLYRIYLKIKAYNKISKLLGKSNGSMNLLAGAIKEFLRNQLTKEEKSWIQKIESLRKNLNSSTDLISIVDFGAGTSELNLTNAEMLHGRVLNRVVGEVCRKASKPYFWSLLLFKLIRKFKPTICLELGTCLGISGSFQAAALELNQEGKFISLEGAESLARIAQQNFSSLGLENVKVVIGKFQDTLDVVLNKYYPIDFAFIDGHHDENATLFYFEKIYPFLSNKAVIVFDDIFWSAGMKRAWKKIMSDDRTKISIDMRNMGIGIFDSEVKEKQSFNISLI